MELQRIDQNGKISYVLLDSSMHLVRPVNRYLDYLRIRGRAENTIKAYGRDLKVYFEFLERKGLSYVEANPHTIQQYIEYLRSSRDGDIEIHVESKRTARTINRMTGTIYGFYCFLSNMEDLRNPMPREGFSNAPIVFKNILYHARKSNKTYRSYFKMKESAYHIHILNEDEIQRMIESLPTYRDRLLFKFLLQSGARIGETLSLKISDIPIPDPMSSVTVLNGIESKGKKRDIYIPTELAVEIDNYIMDVRSEGNSNSEYLFVNNHQHYRDKRISYSGIYGVFKRAAKKAGIEFKFHDTRHTYVTNLIETGMDISVVRILVGHAYVSTTQKYVSLSPQFVAKSLSEYWQKVAYKEGERN